MEKNLKDIIANGRLNWFGAGEDKEDSQNNCYKGLFWDLETREFLRWNQFKQECKSTESSDQ
jgi:hypothetical protein